jgi:hypothetical protein
MLATVVYLYLLIAKEFASHLNVEGIVLGVQGRETLKFETF